MLNVLRLSNSHNMLDRLFHRDFKITTGKISDFDCFYINSLKSEINYDKLRQIVGNAGKTLIVQKGIEKPDDIGVETDELIQKILLNSAIKAVKSANVTNLALIDVDARYSSVIVPLLECVNKLIIITSRVDEYNKYCSKFQKKYGVTPIITDNTDLIDLCSVIIAPDGMGNISYFNLDTVIFSNNSNFSFTIDPSCVDYPFDCDNLTDFSPLDIYAALVVMSTKFKKTVPQSHSFVKNGKKYLFKDVISMITALDIRVSNNYNINIANLFLNKRNGAV